MTEDEIQDPDADEYQRKPLHGAILELRFSELEKMLALPADVRIVAVHQDPTRAAYIIHLIGDNLPEVRDGYMPPQAMLHLQGKRDEDGRWWRRVGFTVSDH